jgi:hypothetical protein
VIAATRWIDAGKIDYALGGRSPVICLGPDARQYGLIAKRGDYAGNDVLIALPRGFRDNIIDELRLHFNRIEPIPPATVLHAGRVAMTVPLVIGHHLHASGDGFSGREGSP